MVGCGSLKEKKGLENRSPQPLGKKRKRRRDSVSKQIPGTSGIVATNTLMMA